MSGLIIDPTPPFIWPDARVLDGSGHYRHATPLQTLFERARGVGGIVSGIDEIGARWLTELVRERNLSCRLILTVWPACPSGVSVLHELLDLQRAVATRQSRNRPVNRTFTRSP